MFGFNSIQMKIGSILIFTVTVILAGYGIFDFFATRAEMEKDLKDFAGFVITQMADGLKEPMWDLAPDVVEGVINAGMLEKRIYAIFVRDEDGKMFPGSKMRDDNWNPIIASGSISGDYYLKRKKITKDDTILGDVEIYLSYRFMREKLRNSIIRIFITFVILNISIFLILFFSIRKSFVSPVNRIVQRVRSVSRGDLSESDDKFKSDMLRKDEIGMMTNDLSIMISRIRDVLKETDMLICAVQDGKINIRGDEQAFSGVWRELVVGVNNVLNAFVLPFKMTASYIELISAGNIPEKITHEYKGDFNNIKDNLNLLIDATFMTTRIAEEIAAGNLTVEVKERSDDDRMMAALNRMVQKLNQIMDQTNRMIQAVGQGRLDVRGNAEAFDGGWHELITGINHLIMGLSNAVSKSAALAQEMSLAREIQMSLLPRLTKNIHPDLEIAADMVPAEQVGGDFYEISLDRSGRLWLAIGDVSGHGVTPGLIMMMAQTVHITITSSLDCDARGLVVTLNQILYKNVHERLNETHFMTFTALKYLGDGKFQHAGAHLSMIVFRQKTGTCELIRTRGIYLNFKKDISKAIKNDEFSMDKGDILVLYTDGLTEAHTPDGKMLDLDGFVKIVERHAHQEPLAMKDMIMADVIKWCNNIRADDMTILIIKRNAEMQG